MLKLTIILLTPAWLLLGGWAVLAAGAIYALATLIDVRRGGELL